MAFDMYHAAEGLAVGLTGAEGSFCEIILVCLSRE